MLKNLKLCFTPDFSLLTRGTYGGILTHFLSRSSPLSFPFPFRSQAPPFSFSVDLSPSKCPPRPPSLLGRPPALARPIYPSTSTHFISLDAVKRWETVHAKYHGKMGQKRRSPNRPDSIKGQEAVTYLRLYSNI